MNKTILNVALAASAMLASSAAMAADGVITFTGEIQATTCVVLPGTGASPGTNGIEVDMGTQSAGGLNASGDTGTRRAFSLTLNNKPGDPQDPCAVGTGKMAEFTFDGDIDMATGNLKTNLANLQIRILHKDKEVHLWRESVEQGPYDNDAVFDLPLVAQYYATGPVGNGIMKADLQYTLDFH